MRDNRWGQGFILDALARYTPEDYREAERIVERVLPRLQHANASVVLSAVKVIMRLMPQLNTDDLVRQVIRKMSPPLGTRAQ